MLTTRLVWQLYAGYVALIVLAAAAVGLATTRGARSPTPVAFGQALASEGRLVRSLLQASGVARGAESLHVLLPSWQPPVGTTVTLFTEEGRVVVAHPKLAAPLTTRERVAARSGRILEESSPSGRVLGVVYEVSGPEGEIALLRLTRPAPDDRSGGGIQAELIAAIAVAIVAALGLGFFFARRITEPLHQMTVAAAAIAGGDYQRRVRLDRADEIGQLSKAFDGMAAQLEERVATITRDRNKLLAIFGGMIEGVVAVDRQERVVHMNAVAGRQIGAQPKASEGRFIWEMTRVRAVPEVLGRTLKTAQGCRQEAHVVGDRGDRILELNAAPLQDGLEQLVGAVVVLHDLTELRRLESVRRDFVANVSHELKTPVTAIRGMAETLVDDPDMDEETRLRFLGRVKDQALRLTTLVTDLLTLARLESASGSDEARRLDLRSPVQAAERAVVSTGLRPGVEVSVELPDQEVPVEGDSEALQEATSNLLDNALKYTPDGGRIWIRLWVEGHEAILEVEDTGIGIPPLEQKRIFERFYRVDRARSRELGGTGLGLSIVKHVCLVHRGDVMVESQPGIGSTFRVRLPVIGDSV